VKAYRLTVTPNELIILGLQATVKLHLMGFTEAYLLYWSTTL